MNKKLAICIPTYNREVYLKECLESIIKELLDYNIQPDIEICISDNCSTDNTKAMIEQLIVKSSIGITYHCNKENIGPDLNFLKCVEIATTKYCWFMGSDDAIIPGAFNEILNKINSFSCDAYVYNRTLCNINLKPIKKDSFFDSPYNKIYHTEIDADFINYFDNSSSIGAIFSFLSSIVINKKKWDEIVYDNTFTGTAYSHVSIIISYLLSSNCKLQFVNTHIVYCRVGNDHFLTEGLRKRVLIDLNGYLKLSEIFIKYNRINLKTPFLSVLKREYNFYKLLRLRSMLTQADWNEIKTQFFEIIPYQNLLIVDKYSINKAKFLRLINFLSFKLQLLLSK